MEHLNYSRQLVRYCMDMQSLPNLDHELRMRLSRVVYLHRIATKFLLPSGGRLYDDKELRAIDESTPLRLPYPYLCLEYHSDETPIDPGTPIGLVNGIPQYEQEDFVSAPKHVIYAREQDGFIVVTVAFWTRHDGAWRILPECGIPMTDYLDRRISFFGRPGIRAAFHNHDIPLSDYMDELGALLCFLNVLQCSNIHVERSEPKNAGKKIKAALPFDTYHVLTIDVPGKAAASASTGGHRSPREHLRRGHIRRLSDGRRIWVNATVVAAGRSSGTVTKAYSVRRST